MKLQMITCTLALGLLVLMAGCAQTISSPVKIQSEQLVVQPAAQIDSTTGMAFVFVKGGCFTMLGRSDDDNPQNTAHQVCVKDFLLGKYEVTQGEWEKIMGSNPSQFKECGSDCPVENVSWLDIQEFILRLNSKSGKAYRLPTEAEWEYAARSGGQDESFSGSNDAKKMGDYAWYRENSGNTTHKVGMKKPNGLGLYDMSGNVVEWCQDWYTPTYYTQGPNENPSGPASGKYRVLRGGSWNDIEVNQRTDDRGRDEPDGKAPYNGLRLLLPVR